MPSQRKPPAHWTAADFSAAGCAVRHVELNVPVGTKLGLQLQKPLLGQLGIAVSKVAPDGAASRVSPSIRAGDVVVEVDGKAAAAWRLPRITELLRPKGSAVRVALVSRAQVDAVVAAALPTSSGTMGTFGDDEPRQYNPTTTAGPCNASAEPTRDGHGATPENSTPGDYPAQPRSLYDDSHHTHDPAVSNDSEYGMRADDTQWGGGYEDAWRPSTSGGRPQESAYSTTFRANSFVSAKSKAPRDTTDSPSSHSRWEHPDDDDDCEGGDARWGGRFGGPILSPVPADEMGAAYQDRNKAALWRSANRAEKMPAHAYVEPAGSVAEANDPNRASRDLERYTRHDDFKAAVRAETQPNEYVEPAGSAAVANTRAPRDIERLDAKDDFKVPLKGKETPAPLYEPAGSVADANNPKREIRDLARLSVKSDFKTMVKGGLVPMATVVHEPYVDPGKKRSAKAKQPGRLSPAKNTRPKPANPSPRKFDSKGSTSRLPVSRGGLRSRDPSPLPGHTRATTHQKQGGARAGTRGKGDSFEHQYYADLVSQYGDAARRYRSVWSEYQTVTRQHSDLIGECHIAGLAAPVKVPPVARWDSEFDATAATDVGADVLAHTASLRTELQHRETLLSKLQSTVESVRSVRDAALLAAIGVVPLQATLYRCGEARSFGIQIETDERRSLLPTRVSATDRSIATRVCDGEAPQVGDIVVNVNGASTLLWSHEDYITAFGKGETVRLEFVDPECADQILAVTTRFVTAADAAALKRPPSAAPSMHDFEDEEVLASSSASNTESRARNRYAWQDGLDFMDKMEARSMELQSLDIDADSTLQMEYFTLQEIRAGLGML